MKIKVIIHTVIMNQNRILLLKRADSVSNLPGYWDIPGGSLEDAEDPKLGAIREVLEETGINIDKPNLFFSFSNADKPKDVQYITLVHKASTTNTEVVLAPKEHQEYLWIETAKVLGFIKTHKVPDYLETAIKGLIEK